VVLVLCCWAGWPMSLLEKLGLTALLDKWPAEVLPLAAPVGQAEQESEGFAVEEDVELCLLGCLHA